ncbi:MAG: hypothetical protein HGA62_09435 [Chlorobiaceae bacterium]|nr:hypothetical protein [Chlorobiaceae bacterium]NTV61617.1 hypothetical protein [Chlorobiaceae bacterium]
MNIKNISRKLFLPAFTLFSLCTAGAAAATKTGTTTISIVLPDLIILHYYSALTLAFEQYSQSVSEGSGGNYNVQWTGTTDSGSSMTTSSIQDVLPGTVSMTIPNVWAVRGLSPSGNAQITISVPKSQLASGTSRVNIMTGSGKTEISDNAGHSGTSITTPLNGITAANATIGNVKMTLDFSQTTLAGAHTGGQYMITAVTL